MGKKFTFSRSIINDLGEKEVFTAVEYDSFEEARTAVNNGIRDRLYGMPAPRSNSIHVGAKPTPGTAGSASLNPKK